MEYCLALFIWIKCCARKKRGRLHSSCLPCCGCWPPVRAWRICKGSRGRNTKWRNTVCMHLLCFLQIAFHLEWERGDFLLFVYSPWFLDIHCASYFCLSSLLALVTSKGKYHSGRDTSVLSTVKEEEHTKGTLKNYKLFGKASIS